MSIGGARPVSIMCAVLLVFSGLVAAGQGALEPAVGLEWLRNLNTASIAFETPSPGQPRIVARWSEGDRELLMEGEGLKLSTTQVGARIVCKGLVTIRWRNRTLQHWEIEDMDLNIPREGQATVSAKRIAEFR
jgi:hypothetical protein